MQLGAIPVTMSDSKGTVYEPDGFTIEGLSKVMKIKGARGSLSEYQPSATGARAALCLLLLCACCCVVLAATGVCCCFVLAATGACCCFALAAALCGMTKTGPFCRGSCCSTHRLTHRRRPADSKRLATKKLFVCCFV